mmetsp:Transcript_23495/g.80247  ORF Transcript_23495/g.80247 Transcript_23495/m.80247 type:complete len:320 (+) Transcript_23495:34-993(+)
MSAQSPAHVAEPEAFWERVARIEEDLCELRHVRAPLDARDHGRKAADLGLREEAARERRAEDALVDERLAQGQVAARVPHGHDGARARAARRAVEHGPPRRRPRPVEVVVAHDDCIPAVDAWRLRLVCEYEDVAAVVVHRRVFHGVLLARRHLDHLAEPATPSAPADAAKVDLQISAALRGSSARPSCRASTTAYHMPPNATSTSTSPTFGTLTTAPRSATKAGALTNDTDSHLHPRHCAVHCTFPPGAWRVHFVTGSTMGSRPVSSSAVTTQMRLWPDIRGQMAFCSPTTKPKLPDGCLARVRCGDADKPAGGRRRRA